MDLRQKILDALNEGMGEYTMPMDELERRVGQSDLKPELLRMKEDGLLQSFGGEGLYCFGMPDAHYWERSVIIDTYENRRLKKQLGDLL